MAVTPGSNHPLVPQATIQHFSSSRCDRPHML
jgi:hypothetical protein